MDELLKRLVYFGRMEQLQGYHQLLNAISLTFERGKEQAAKAINTVLVETYWLIGRQIVEFEQTGSQKADYGTSLINLLSNDLGLQYGKGFNRSNLQYMRKFYLGFPEQDHISRKLSWSHYYEILKADNGLARGFYIKQCEKDNWSVRELRRQMQSLLFERLALSTDKNGVLALASEGKHIQHPSDIIKDPYILEFAGFPQNAIYKEDELEQKLIDNLEHFLLELGKGFAYIGRQYRITLGNRHFFIDLVFYHRILKCFVLIDLKRGEIQHEDIGQMNMYLNYMAQEQNMPDDNAPIGIVLGAYKDNILVEYATQNIANQLFVSKYQLHMPDKALLKQELQRLLDTDERES